MLRKLNTEQFLTNISLAGQIKEYIYILTFLSRRQQLGRHFNWSKPPKHNRQEAI